MPFRSALVLASSAAVAWSSLGSVPTATAMDTQLCASGDASCAPDAWHTAPLAQVYEESSRDARVYFEAFDYVTKSEGHIDCKKFDFRHWVATFEELVGMSHPEHVRNALNMLEAVDACRERGDVGPNDRLVTAHSAVRAPYSDWQAVPMANHVFRLYQSRKPTLPEDRQLLLRLLEHGVDSGWTTHGFHKKQLQELGTEDKVEERGMLKMAIAQSKMDLDLVEKLIDSGVSIAPIKNKDGKGNSFTPLLATVADCNGKVDRPILQLLYKINYNLTAGIPLDEAIANQDQNTEFHGNWGFFNNMRISDLPSMRAALRRIAKHAEEHGEVVSGHKKADTGKIDEELSLEILEALGRRPDFDLSDITLTDEQNSNFLHFAALDGFDRCIKWVGRSLAHVFPVVRRGHVARDVFEAITTKNKFGRTPAHNAAALYGTGSDVFQALAELEQFAGHILDDALQAPDGPPKPESPSRTQRMATTSKDQFGRTPESYDTKMVIKDKLALAGGETQRTYMAVVNSKKHSASATTLTYTPFKPVPSQDDWEYSYTEADSGGWGVATTKVRETLDDLKGRCDAIIHQGAPTANELQAYIAQNYPVVFKGAALDWTFRKEWTYDKFMEKYGNERLPVGNTIYPTFLYQPEEGVRMRDWLESWGHPDFVPDALPSAFSTTFMGGVPQLKQEGTLEAGQLLTKHHFPFFSHFFAGASGTGAPHHWHMAAMNTVAYGRKRWFLFPPKDSVYSIKPVSRMLFEDVQQLRDNPNTTMLECVQEAGDIMIVPTFWGHATLNVEPTIGVAYELDSGFCHS